MVGIPDRHRPYSPVSSDKQLPKLAGIVPIERQSPDHASLCTPMSRRGRPLQRLTVYRAVVALLRHHGVFKTYVERLIARAAGQNPLANRAAIGAAINKVPRIVHTLLRWKEMFNEKET